jgi:glycosyltransferase involved in cell wall biosynthesis
MPTRNRGDLAVAAAQSVIAQTAADWELVVTDDGSTDDTPERVRRLDPRRIKVLRHGNGGNPAAARNRGIAAGRGTFVAFLDSDDLFESEKLERQLAAMERAPWAGWSYTFYRRIDATGAPLPDATAKAWVPHSGWILDALIPIDAIVATSTVTVRRELLDRAGGFDESLHYCHDYDLWFRLAHASQALALSERLAAIRAHADSHQADRRAAHEAWVRVYQKLGRRLHGRSGRMCYRQLASHVAWLADENRRCGAYSRSVLAALRSVRYHPTAAAGWVALGKALIAAATPGRARGAAPG